MAKKQTVSQKFDKLEEITQEFESGDIQLEKAIPKFKTAVKLAKELKKELSTMEAQIEEISLDFSQSNESQDKQQDTNQEDIDF